MTTDHPVLALEDRLAAAMKAGDAATLEALLAEGLVFIDQNGRSQGKAEDLAMHRSGLLRLDRLEIADRKLRELGPEAAVVTLRAKLEGRFRGAHVAGHFAYTRVWQQTGEESWQVVAAHCSTVA
ncbi:nuclear transport factor 2 family protein [Roseomonas sp. USHLN139]|uniref:nuclear transport factor 2 family protein n=1 Tax=Roseomonas sp. USHLN139 TaxID=3081298 RepID=UPI003B023DA7